MKRKNPLTVILLVIALLLIGYLIWSFLAPDTTTSYSVFRENVESGKVEKVEFTQNGLIYTVGGTQYSTQDPHSPTLMEELLLKDIKVTYSDTTLDSILNTAFNVIFLLIVLYGIYKLVAWYASTFKTVHHTGVRFSDIAGMDALKRDMQDMVEVLKSGKSQNSVRETRGIILEGPPGNGKTLFAKALAEEADMNFIATKGADFQGAVMGLGAMKVKMLFNKARKKRPCIIFIDEFDSIGEKRNYAGSGIDKENNRILTTLLNEMDGFTKEKGIMVIAATNSFDSLDPALVRPGRFDLKYTISNPDRNTRLELINIYTKGKAISPSLTPEMLSVLFDGLSSSAIESILNEAWIIKNQSGKDEITIECIIASAAKCREKLNMKIKK